MTTWDKFKQRHGSLGLERNCGACAIAINQVITASVAPDLTVVALSIVRNANRTALQQFGHDRETQQATIAAAIRELIANAATPKVSL